MSQAPSEVVLRNGSLRAQLSRPRRGSAGGITRMVEQGLPWPKSCTPLGPAFPTTTPVSRTLLA